MRLRSVLQAAPAANHGSAAVPADDEAKGQGGEADDGIAPAADEGKGQGGEKAVAADASVAANAKLDMDGHPMMVGDTVLCYAQKNNNRYNERKATADRLNSTPAVLTMN